VDRDPIMSGEGKTIRQVMTIANQRGLHARAAALFVKTAGTFDAEITVAKDGTEVSGLSIMGLMMLAASQGSKIEVAASGRQATQAVDALAGLVTGKFEED
jgi:phosphocarrier protein